MDIRIIGDDIMCEGEIIATIHNASSSLAGDFKDWIKEHAEMENSQEEIKDCRDTYNSLINALRNIIDEYEDQL